MEFCISRKCLPLKLKLILKCLKLKLLLKLFSPSIKVKCSLHELHLNSNTRRLPIAGAIKIIPRNRNRNNHLK